MPGNVKLISVTPEAEKTILYIARVSSPNQDNEDPGLLRFLIRNGHWSPFEHASMTLEIQTSRAIGTQILRHRSFTFQEFSQRYAQVGQASYIEYEARASGTTNRQSSVDSLDDDTKKWWRDRQQDVFDFAYIYYDEALTKGIAPECARMVLPLNTRTVIYMTGTLRSWIHYLGDGPGGRTNEHTQLEHKEIAEEGKMIFCKQFPVIADALGWIKK